ncbi:MAG TPA: hypothetical protein PKK61_11965 [Defluviitaleaceae bacterium]|nr:hypothetical protein [Defluviitaleaceae bacterium]
MTDRELLELIAAKVGELTKNMSEVKSRLTSVENIVTRIENGHGKKLQALFDGYKQHADQLERIEKEVSKHDEFILRRIK